MIQRQWGFSCHCWSRKVQALELVCDCWCPRLRCRLRRLSPLSSPMSISVAIPDALLRCRPQRLSSLPSLTPISVAVLAVRLCCRPWHPSSLSSSTSVFVVVLVAVLIVAVPTWFCSRLLVAVVINNRHQYRHR